MPEFARSANCFVLFVVSAAIAALLLLPLGQLSLTSGFFNALWTVHLALQAGAVFCSLQLFARFAQKSCGIYRFAPLLLVGCLLLLIAARAVLPVTAKDALIYHLAVPKLWLQAGQVHEIEWHEWSYFPMLLGLVQSGFLSRGLETLCAFYHLSYLFITCAAVGLASFQLSQSTRSAALAYLLCFSTPLFIKLGAEPMADLAVCAYIALAFLCTLNYMHNQSSAMMFCAALGLGLALCAKYSALLTVCIFLICLPVWFETRRLGWREFARTLLTQLVVIGLIFAPWLFRNYSWTGNPLYPFLQGIFGNAEYNRAFVGNVAPLTHRAQVYGESTWELLLLPVRMLLQGKDDNPRFFDGVPSPILLLGFVAWLRLPKLGWLKFVLLFSILHILCSIFAFHALLRYQAPVLTLLIVPAAIYLAELLHSSSSALRSLSRALFLTHLLFALLYATKLTEKDGSWLYLSSQQSRAEFLISKIAEFPSAQFINANLPADAAVYLIFTGNRYYYYDRPVYGSYFSGDAIIEALNRDPASSTLLKFFRERRVSHVLLHIARTNSSFDAKLSPAAKIAWQEFVKNNLEPIHKRGLYFLGHIKFLADK